MLARYWTALVSDYLPLDVFLWSTLLVHDHVVAWRETHRPA